MQNFKDIVLYEHKYIWHTIKPGTPEHGTMEHRNTGGTYNRILAEQLEYHGIVEHEKSSGKT